MQMNIKNKLLFVVGVVLLTGAAQAARLPAVLEDGCSDPFGGWPNGTVSVVLAAVQRHVPL